MRLAYWTFLSLMCIWSWTPSLRAEIVCAGQTNFVTTTNLTAGTNLAGRTLLAAYYPHRFRKGGLISHVTANIASLDPGTNGLYFLVARPNGVNWDLVSQSGYVTPVVGTNTYTLATPMPCRDGDALGCWLSPGALALVASAVPGNILYRNGELNGTNLSAKILVENRGLDLFAALAAPEVAFTGDSIMSGFNLGSYWYPFMDINGGTYGTWSASIPHRVQDLYLTNLNYMNYARRSSGFDWIVASALPNIINDGATTLWIHSGVNDANAGVTWSNILADLDLIRAAFPLPKRIYVAELLPNGLSDAVALTDRTWNANLAAWCQTNGATLVRFHDAFGVLRPSTEYLDDLAPEYASDGVHLSQAGVDLYAQWVAAYLLHLEIAWSNSGSVVSWDRGVLQTAEELGGQWTDVPGAASPYAPIGLAVHRFYRLRN